MILVGNRYRIGTDWLTEFGFIYSGLKSKNTVLELDDTRLIGIVPGLISTGYII